MQHARFFVPGILVLGLWWYKTYLSVTSDTPYITIIQDEQDSVPSENEIAERERKEKEASERIKNHERFMGEFIQIFRDYCSSIKPAIKSLIERTNKEQIQPAESDNLKKNNFSIPPSSRPPPFQLEVETEEEE